MWHSKHALSLGSACLLAGAAFGQSVNEGFETYNLGPLDGQGDWHGWDGINTTFANVDAPAFAMGVQSAKLEAGADSVREFTQFTSGHYILKTWCYIPTGFIGKSYFIVMNSYQNGGPYEWSGQVGMNGDLARLQCDCGSTTSVDRALVYDQWVDLVFDVDLTNDVCNFYYNTAAEPTPIATYPWSKGVFGGDTFLTLAIDAIDLYPDAVGFPHVTAIYWDDITIEPAGPQPVGTAYCYGDGSGTTPCPCGNTGGTGEGCANSTGAGATMDAVGSTVAANDDIVFSGHNLLPAQPALLFVGDNAINGGNGIIFGDGLRCAGLNVVRLGVMNPDGAGEASWGPGLGAVGGWTAGDTRRFQVWYRDPIGSPCAAGFNLSHGLEITFN
jgi:hypothetical protein